MDLEKKAEEVTFNVTDGNVNSNARVKSENRRPRQNRKCLIITGVIIAGTIVLATAVLVPVLVTQSKDAAAEQKDDGCGPYSYPGVNFSELRPKILSHVKTCPLKGSCWTGSECYECFKLDEWKVGNINNIPVCCPQCEIKGMTISNSKCDCRT